MFAVTRRQGTRAGSSAMLIALVATLAVAAPALAATPYMTWGPTHRIDSYHDLTAVSCATTAFCVATDNRPNGTIYNPGYVVMFSNGTWSQPRGVDPKGGGINSVSCPTTTYCAAVDNEAKVIEFHGTSWGAPHVLIPNASAGLGAVSCPTATFCMASDLVGHYVLRVNGVWQARVRTASAPLEDLSCVAATFCAGADEFGNLMLYNGARWTKTHFSPSKHDFLSIECASRTMCLAGDALGNVVRWNGSTWTSTHILATNGPTAEGITSISCTLPRFCVALAYPRQSIVDDRNIYLVYYRGRWTAHSNITASRRATAISCIGRICRVVTAIGTTATGTVHGTI